MRTVVSSAGLAAWLGRRTGLGHPAYAVATALGSVLLLTSASASVGVWLYGRARRVVQERRYRALGTPGERVLTDLGCRWPFGP